MQMFAKRYGLDAQVLMRSTAILFSGDVTKCAETLQKLISTRREYGTRHQVGTFDAASEHRIESVLRAGSERPLLLAS